MQSDYPADRTIHPSNIRTGSWGFQRFKHNSPAITRLSQLAFFIHFFLFALKNNLHRTVKCIMEHGPALNKQFWVLQGELLLQSFYHPNNYA